MVKEKKVKVKASRPCKISTKTFSYEFKGVPIEVNKSELNVLLDTGLIEEVK